MAKERQWIISRDEFVDEVGQVDEEAFRAAVTQELAGLENIGHRVAGALMATPIRQKAAGERFVGVEEYETIAWLFQHVAFVPAARAPEPEVTFVAPEPSPDGSEPSLVAA